ncbi:Platelet-activating factor acetylhydrolase, isoform II [Nonomuraea solani]|uniref:Platelet-activating factor acetylhydrolase, isoform II n=1 Tax=Nonomuraea solani TaxID=1144553 RepID=A0A1H6ESZ7_9ACTN|nr:alpha/beta hydrolase [Nonomuraea solani]SEH00523.1 Platelet-activating factor acetylhydrolase, isoform II [Nonomuraea solani]
MKRTLAVVTTSLIVLGAAPQAQAAALALPEPTGPKPVGTTTLHLVDKSRPDPWNPEADTRELLVTLYYPARKAVAERRPYVTPQESAAILAAFKDVPPDALTKVRTYAGVDAPVRGGRLPLVVMSPGFSFPRATLTSLAEDAASRGYLVAAVEHTYESVGTTFPDGRTTSCLACVKGQDQAKVVASRVKDVRFVLDELTGGRWGKSIDRSRIAMVGHSVGGYSAAHAALADRRIGAGVNLDGSFKLEEPLKKPFMLFGAPARVQGTDTSWKTAWPNLTGWKRWIAVAGTDHAAFVDYAVLRPRLGLPAQELDGTQALKITRAHLAGFLDRHLLGKRTPVEDFPEVTDHTRKASAFSAAH